MIVQFRYRRIGNVRVILLDKRARHDPDRFFTGRRELKSQLGGIDAPKVDVQFVGVRILECRIRGRWNGRG